MWEWIVLAWKLSCDQYSPVLRTFNLSRGIILLTSMFKMGEWGVGLCICATIKGREREETFQGNCRINGSQTQLPVRSITGDPYSIKRHAYSIHNFISTQSTSMREIIAGTEGWGGGRGRRRRHQARLLLLIIMVLQMLFHRGHRLCWFCGWACVVPDFPHS